MPMDSAIRRKLTVAIIAATLAVAAVSVVLLQKKQAAGPSNSATAAQDAERSADTSPAQLEQVPQRSQDVFIPPVTDATGSSPPPK